MRFGYRYEVLQVGKREIQGEKKEDKVILRE